MKRFLKGLAALVACGLVGAASVWLLFGPIASFFLDEPIIYIKTSTGEAFEAKTYDRNGKEVWHSAKWARKHRNDCKPESCGNEYEVHRDLWVD